MKKLLNHSVLLITSLLLLILLFKNPYSERNLIANLEPFPDAQHYTTTPRCFLNGQSWKMCRLNQNLEGAKPAVPPAYSLSLLPAYLINSDVRTFYFTNIILSLVSLTLLYKISNNFFKNKIITGVVLLFYATNYFSYWYPTLAMAENIFIPLFLGSILLLQNKISKTNSFLVGIVAAGFYATKFAFAPLTIVFPLVYFLKVISTSKNLKEKITQASLVSIPAGLLLLNLVGIKELLDVINQITNGALDAKTSANVSSGNSYFSITYFSKHFRDYASALLGESQRFLWDMTPLVERWIALPGLLGLVAGFKFLGHKFAKSYLVVATIAQLLFISTFYVVDIRYVYHFLPILLLGFGFFLQLLSKSVLKDKINFLAFTAMILIIYLGSNAIRLKSVVMINLKYAETPWWYLSQLEMNNYFDNKYQQSSDKPFLVTLASPFLVDNYSNQNYKVLPLDSQQDFRKKIKEVWGVEDHQTLTELYQNQLLNEQEVFITNYGTSGSSHFKQSFDEIEENFKLTKVSSGCHDLCNIYQLESL